MLLTVHCTEIRILFKSIMTGLFWSFVLFAIAAAKADTIVTLPDGTKLQGIQEGNIVAFKGVPFAKPPVGTLRWAPPQPWVNPNPDQIVDATKHGHACTQWFWGDDHMFDDGSEDCLHLNVFVNLNVSLTSGTKLPVGVFVHGGSYITGTSYLPLYDGVDMIEYMQGKAILVTTNYRLNVFGFLGGEALRALDPESGSTGNYGIQDQRLAFAWVRQNIAAFGGDASRVTIFGESAGAGSMSNHLTMKKSWDYFDSVILESGAFSKWVTNPMDCAQKSYDALLREMRCEDVACLQSKSDVELKRHALSVYTTACPWAPVADGVEISTHPWIALANGDVADVPILHGSNADEGALFTVFPHDGNAEDLAKYWTLQGYSTSEQETLTSLYVTDKTYPVTYFNNSLYWWAAQRAYGDDFMSCPAKYTSVQLSQLQLKGTRQSDTYMYHFEHTPRDITLTRHVSEIPFAFHQEELINHPSDRAMADVMCSYWGNFFASNDPNEKSIGLERLPRWTPYVSTQDALLAIVDWDNCEMTKGVKKTECDWVIDRLDGQIRAAFE